MSGPASNPLARPLRALARVLSYPDEALRENLGAVAEALCARAELAPAERASLERFLGWMRDETLLALQAAYVDTFDRGKQVSLYLFEHVYGESRARGPAMVELVNAYRAHGLEIDGRELPDYLPLLLEFCAELTETEARAWLDEIGHVVQQVHVRLARRDSRYAAPFRALLRLARLDPSPEELARAATAEERDDTPAALDRVWMEAPVTFGPDRPAASCATAGQPRGQPIQWLDNRKAADRSEGR